MIWNSKNGVGVDVLVEIDVVVPEHEIVRGERRAVGPLGALAQVDRRRLAVVADLPVAGEAGDDLGARVIEGQDLVERNDPVAVLVVGRSGERSAPVAAVFADFAQRLHDEKLRRLGQALVDRGQLSGLHLLGENRSLLEGLRKGLGVKDDLRSFQLSDQRRADFCGRRRRGLRDCRPRPHREGCDERKTRQHKCRAHRFHTILLWFVRVGSQEAPRSKRVGRSCAIAAA